MTANACSTGRFGTSSRSRLLSRTTRESELVRSRWIPARALLIRRELGATFPDLGTAARAHPSGDASSDQQLAIRPDRIEVDRVRVHDDRAGPVNPHAVQAVHGIPARATAADDEDPGAGEGERVEERLVARPLRALDAHPWSIPAVRIRTACPRAQGER